MSTYLAPILQQDGYTGVTGTTPYRPVTDGQKSTLQSIYYNSPVSDVPTTIAPLATVININFDGTQNNGEYPATGESPTNVWELSKLQVNAYGKGNTLYVPGIGAQTVPSGTLDANGNPAPGSSPSDWDSTPWKAGEIGKQILDNAYKRLTDRVSEVLDADPDADVSLNLSGFSRGGAMAVAFANLVNERGIPDGKGGWLYPPGQVPIDSMTLFDPVDMTRGTLNTTWPTNVANSLVMVATEEGRYIMPAMQVGPDAVVVAVPADHCGVGGSWTPDGTSAVTLKIARDFQANSGMDNLAEPSVPPNWENMNIYNAGLDNYGNVKWSFYDGGRYYEGAKLGDPSVQQKLGYSNEATPAEAPPATAYNWSIPADPADPDGEQLILSGRQDAYGRTVIAVYTEDGAPVLSINPGDAYTRLPDGTLVVASNKGGIVTTQSYKDGLTETVVTDKTGKVLSSSETEFTETGTTTQYYDANDNLYATGTLTRDEDGSASEIINYTDGRTKRTETDPDGKVISITNTEFDPDDGSATETITYPDGSGYKYEYDEDGDLVSEERIPSAAETLIGQTIGTLQDAMSLIKAIQSGEPLPILASGLKVANLAANLNGTPNLNLSGASSAAAGILSLMSLNDALERGDTVGALTAGAQAVTYSATAYANFAGHQNLTSAIDAGEFGAAGEAIGAISEALPYLSIINSIAHGDITGAVIGVVSYFVPVIGWAYAVYSIVKSLFGGDDIPDPWGNGRFIWNGTGITYQSEGETGGKEAVSNVMNNVLATMNAIIEREREQNPGASLGVIPNRMPTLGYDMSGYRYTDIDPLTGAEKHPALRFDTDGRPYNAEPGSPESYQSILEGMVRSALTRGAIAPMWEVRTAKMQTDAGDPKAGLSEEERAGRDGKLAAPITGSIQTFRPVALDLDGDGIEATDRVHGVEFDVDDSGYMKQTAWVKNDDAFLVLDRDYNGQFDSGRELFSNGKVALSNRGLASMAWVDANYDGRLTSSDPVWGELKVWQDADQDGVQDQGEVMALETLGITELNYSMGTFTQAGVKKQLASPDLEADKDGIRITVVPEGILVQASGDGHISLVVTRIDDKTVVEPNRDGVTGYEDIEIVVPGASLLQNDTLGGILGRDLTITGLTNFRHGTGFLDANGSVHFMPEANYAGDEAGFDYLVLAQNGQEGKGTVDITLQGINDAPTLDHVDHETRLVYGYAPDNNYEGGEVPIYEPYTTYNEDDGTTTVHNTPTAYEDTGRGRIVGADVDDPASALTYEIVNQPQYGVVTVNADGSFQYTSYKAPDTPSDHILVNGQYAGIKDGDLYYPGNLPSNAVYPTTDVFQVRIKDPSGATTTQSISVPHYGPYLPKTPSGGGGKKPIAVDLNGNGFEFVNVNDSNVFFDVNGSGRKTRISWVGKDDGLLAYDIDGDGKIDKAGEIMFASYKNGAQTDLEGLAAFDSNGDGYFSALDEKWAKFGVWQDADQDGVTDEGEFRTLTQMGVIRVNLTSDGHFQVINGQTVHGVGSMLKSDGNQVAIADVTLSTSSEIQVSNVDGTISTVDAPPFSPNGEELNGTEDKDLILGKNGNNVVHGYAGDDVVFEDGGNDIIDSGDGNDLIYSGADNDMVMAGMGDDVIYGGLGDDLVFGGDGHDAIFAEGGNDVVFGGDGNDIISGGWGNDVLSGDDGDDQVYGESGYDALFGRNGNDVLMGMDGNDRLDGGAGNDLLDGGTGADEMLGGIGDDVYVVDDSGDSVTELAGEGNDTVQTDQNGYVLGANVENLILTGSDNLSGTGNELDNVLTGNWGENVLAGGKGNDTYVVNNVGDIVIEKAGEGVDTVKASVSYALSANVENLTLTGAANSDATGNELSNRLIGNAGNNVLDGGSGADYLAGGLGNDTYIVDQNGDVVTEQPGAGTDTVLSAIDYILGADVENLTLTGSADLAAFGNEIDNVITGNGGNNWIDGSAGADTMAGGGGNDTYVVDNGGDTVTESARGGVDTVLSSVSYALSAQVENITLTGTADINATGNELDNTLVGNDGRNILDGGAGADAMIGGAGDDTYIVDNLGDIVADVAEGGYDTVLSSVNFVLPEHVEQLSLTGSESINGTGNELGNVITGNTAANVINGLAGADKMAGGDGNDIYYVDQAGDIVTEAEGGGYDTVRSAITLTAPDNVERLELLGQADINATGNSLDNVLIGNTGNNRLDGAAGADVMAGGAGNDTYIVDHAADTIVETADAGTDQVYASVTYTLAQHVENLTLTGVADINGTGNELANTLVGNSGRNVLDGGAGADFMQGGQGNDDYIVDNAGDRVVEAFQSGSDTIYSSVSYVLPENVENLILTGMGSIDATGNNLDNVLIGNDSNNYLAGGEGNDTIDGRAGNDTLNGGKGRDSLIGGTGNDTFVFNLGDDLDQMQDMGGIDAARFGTGLSINNVALRVTQEGGIYTAHVRVLNAGGCEQPDQGFDFVVTKDVTGKFVSPIERFEFADGMVTTFDDVMIKTQITYGKSTQTSIVTGRNDDIIFADVHTMTIKSGTGNDQIIVGYNLDDDDDDDGDDGVTFGTSVYGEGGNDYLKGSIGNDVLDGGCGTDILRGEGGRDVLRDTLGNNAFFGGSGSDSIEAGTGNDFIAGGTGNDTIRAGGGANVIAYNVGDGYDTILPGAGASNTLSLGTGDDDDIDYADLSFRQNGLDLQLIVGESDDGDRVIFKDWYTSEANRNFVTLQIVSSPGDDDDSEGLQHKVVESYDFGALVKKFDAAKAANPRLTSWSLMNGMLNAHLSSSDTAALGGELAAGYGQTGSMSTSVTASQDVLRNPSFGTQAQNIGTRFSSNVESLAA